MPSEDSSNTHTDGIYSLAEHRHRFSAWAAGRAAGRGSHSLTIKEATQLLDAAGVRKFVEVSCIEYTNDKKFDDVHLQWRETMVRQKGQERPISHGGAAKIINVYLKSAFILGAAADQDSAKFVHPPIDDRLLTVLAKKCVGLEDWRKLKEGGWSKFDSERYQKVIDALRRISAGRPLWMVEEHWSPHS